MNLTHRVLSSFNEVNMYINIYFDDFFWDDFSNEDLYNSYINAGYKLVLFENFDTPYALIAYKTNTESEHLDLLKDKYEILLFEVSDRTCGKNRGVGEEVINYFKSNVAIDIDICGYSLGTSANFWKKVATEYDEEAYKFLEETEFNGEIMMYFNIKH